MGVITIRERAKSATGFQAELIFENGGQYEITIADPFTPQQEKALEWYFEGWIRRPYTDTTIAAKAANSIVEYGESLFTQVFKSDFDAYGEYQPLRSRLSEVQVVIESKTFEFQGLHWEALKDPDLPRPVAVDAGMTRRLIKPVKVKAQVNPSPVINLLLVTARPDEEADVGYRTISRPLIEAIQTARLRVNVELLRPGTFEALAKHLQIKGEGFYHIIHFDAHGAVGTYEQIKAGVDQNRYLYQNRYGQKDLTPYEGRKAFLFLEGKQKGDWNPVEANDLAALLTGKGIPVCILNACQSGKQVNEDEDSSSLSSETSLGSLLMAAGMQMVVAMGYSVTVSAARILMEQIYQSLFDEPDFAEAIRVGRLELLNRKNRKAYFNQTVELEDWLLPVVYQNQRVELNLRSFTPQEDEAYFEALGNLEPYKDPTYGFVGRDLEILKIERSLLRHNCLLLRGMGGTGKTTLLNYLHDWWRVTQFADQIFYFGYDRQAWTLEQILFEVGKGVYNRFEQAQFQAMSRGAQVSKLATKLSAERHVLILDNLESVTGEPLAIQNTLDEAEQSELRDFLRRLIGGKTLVVFGSRSGEAWLQSVTFQENVYPLQGLDRESRTVLAEKILERQVKAPKRIEALRLDKDFERLMTVLAGYPLAMEVVLANLAQQSPGDVLKALQGADVDLNVGGDERTNNILKCVDYSHGNLSPEAQQVLLCLAPFSGVIFQPVLPQYLEQLQALEPLRSLPFEAMEDAIAEAINWGLLSPHESGIKGLFSIQPIFPYFLNSQLQSSPEEIRDAISEGFRRHFDGLSQLYQQYMKSKDPQEKQLGQLLCQLDYENLYCALQLCLVRQTSISIFFCLEEYLDQTQNTNSRIKLSEYVCLEQAKYQPESRRGRVGLHIVMTLDRLACCYYATRKYKDACKTYEQVLEITPTLIDVSEEQKASALSSTFHQLGIVAQELREWDEARKNFNQALEIKIEYGDRYSQARTFHQLGRVAQELREWDEARKNFNQALEINIEYGDRYSQASTYFQLGKIAEELGELEEAKAHYLKALEITAESNDEHGLDVSVQNLARFYKATQDDSLLSIAAPLLGTEMEALKQVMLDA